MIKRPTRNQINERGAQVLSNLSVHERFRFKIHEELPIEKGGVHPLV
jgi:hypothetical protein